MNTNKFFLWIVASLLSGAFCAMSAMAEVQHPRAYVSLQDVQLHPAAAPRLQGGVTGLSGKEARYEERLPLQLRGAIKTVESRKYRPKSSRLKTIQF